MAKSLRAGLALALVPAFGLFGFSARANAGGITVTNSGDAAALVNALLAGGTGGITVTGYTLSNQSQSVYSSTGFYSTLGPNNYNLTGSGVVLSTGDAADLGSGPARDGLGNSYGTNATAPQAALLSQISPNSSYQDVTELTITFDADAATTSVNFGIVFASAEYPKFADSHNDVFGLFLNGKNIAFAGGAPVNIMNPLMVNTDYANYTDDPRGADGTLYQETALLGLLVGPGGNPFINYSGAVVAGSTGNTLTFIIADANDDLYDTAVYISGLGNAPPPGTVVPEPASMVLMGLGLSALALYGRRRRASK